MWNLKELKQWIGLAVLALVALSSLVACEPPVSTYRRSALRPSTLSSIGAVPVEEGKTRVQGGVSATGEGVDFLGQFDGPGLYIADTTLHGEGEWGLGEHVAVGVVARYTHLSWAESDVSGLPPLTEGRYSLGLGPSLTLHTGGGPGFYGTVNASLALTSVPWSSWELEEGERERCTDPTADDPLRPTDACITAKGGRPPGYRQLGAGVEVVPLFRGSLTGGYMADFGLAVYGGVGAQNSIVNIGFSEIYNNGSTISADQWALMLHAGSLLRLDNGLVTQLQLNFGGWGGSTMLGAQLMLGVEL